MKNKAVPILISGVFFLCLQTFSANFILSASHAANIDSQEKNAATKNYDILISQSNAPVLTEQEGSATENNAGLPLPSIIHLLLFSKASISGLVWNDSNGNQRLDPGENGVENVRVYVDYDSNASYAPGDPSILTDANGRYTIPRIRTGDRNVYIDIATLPVGYEITTIHPYPVNLTSGQNIDDADFGIRDRSASIDGYIWNDSDSNGSINNDEVPIEGVNVYVDLNNDDEYTLGEPLDTTDENGHYQIQQLTPGTYKVHVDNGTLPVAYHRTPVYGTNPSLVIISSNQNTSLWFGYQLKVTISGVLHDTSGNTWANITLFIDLNGNGVYDPGEPITTTDLFGRYVFNDLLPGTYTVLILSNLLPDGYDILVSPGEITTSEGESYTADFLTQAQPASIVGIVWDDESGNGRLDPGENGFAGITVFLDTNNNGVLDAGELSTDSDATGTYSFVGLDQGGYYIRAVDSSLLVAHIQTTSNPVFSKIGPGEINTETKFGYQRKIAPKNSMLSPTRLSWGSDGNLYVSDHRIGSVFIFDSTLSLKSELRGLDKPLGVITDGAGNIYVGNEGRKNVEVYNFSSSLQKTIGDGTIEMPNDLAFDRDNNLYVLDSAQDTVLVYDPSGALIRTIGSSLQLNYAVSIAINYRDDGGTEVDELYVADQPQCAIHVFDLDGTYKQSIGTCGTMYTSNWDGLFSGLVAVDVDRNGNIHGLDNNLNVVQVFEPQNGIFQESYNAYLPENENRLNLQSDFSINTADNRVVISNLVSQGVEQVYTIP